MMLQYLDTIIAFSVIILGVSLLITILVQMMSALIGYRGTNLLWGIRTVLSTIEPKLADSAEAIAAQVLRRPIISDSIFSKFKGWVPERWSLASAITVQELARGLSQVAAGMAQGNEKKTADLIEGVLNGVDPEAARRLKLVKETLGTVSPKTAVQMDKIAQEVAATVQGPIGNLEAWFETVEKRASQRFALQMRIWTVIFAILFAFGANLDSIKILKELWTSPEKRAGLVSARETVLSEASVLVPIQNGTRQMSDRGVPPQILGDAMKGLKDLDQEAAAKLGDPPKEFANLDAALKWIEENAKGDGELQRRLAEGYRKAVLAQFAVRADTIERKLAESGFKLEPVSSWAAFKNVFSMPGFLGILITAGFLSLGAPFWFNALKGLSNLRPLVANWASKASPGSA